MVSYFCAIPKGKTITLLVVLILFGITGQAMAAKKWQWTPTFAFYEHYSSNVNLSNEEPIAGFRTQVIPSISAILPSKRRQIKINFNLKLDMRSQDNGDTRNLHWISLNGYLGHELSPRTSYEISAAYDITYTTIDLGVPWFGAFGETTRADFLSFIPALRYRISKKTFTKVGFGYRSITYEDPEGIDGTELNFAWFLSRRFGNRLSMESGFTYKDKAFSNSTGYTQMGIPLTIMMDLTYFKLNISTQYITRSTGSSLAGSLVNVSGDRIASTGVGAGSHFLWGLGFDLGGKLFKLRNTTVNIKITNDIYEDLYGYAYIQQEIKLMSFNIMKKYDIYNELKYGLNDYTAPNPNNGIDVISYYGYEGNIKWYMTKKKSIKGRLMYNIYDYTYVENSGFEDSDFQLISFDLTYDHRLRDWLYYGISAGIKQSSGSQESANYGEYFAGLYAKASW